MLQLCASLLAHTMKPSCSIEQGGVTQPHSEGNITGPIANILYGEVVKKTLKEKGIQYCHHQAAILETLLNFIPNKTKLRIRSI